jgi:hypothetical protein
MNPTDLRRYWVYKYQEKFKETYQSSNFPLDIFMLKRLHLKHNEFVILEAMDRFFRNETREVSTINFFCTKKVFDSKFKDLICQEKVVKYSRWFNNLPAKLQKQIQPLLTEYKDYCTCEHTPDNEKVRKKEIEKRLEELMAEYADSKTDRG